jgi:hypothetical protein
MRHIVLLVMLVFFLGLTAVAQSKKEQISTLQLQIDSVNNVLTVTRGQLDQSQQQFKETDEFAKRLDAQLVLSKKDLQFTRDSLRASSNENVALKSKLDLNKKELETLAEKNERLKSELTLVRDSLVRASARVIELTNQNSTLKTEKEQLKLDLDKQTEALAQSPSAGEPFWCDLSEVNGVYTMQKRNPDWDFPQTVTVKIDTKNITFNAFGDLRTYEYSMKAMNGTIHMVFSEFSEDSGDYLGGGEIEFTPDGIILTVEPELENKQVYFKRSSK